MTEIFVFVGPSISRAEAAKICDAVFLPPVQQGDIIRAIERRPRCIGIIDGFFEAVPAVWHKELLLALSVGIPVFGAASMGALRAAELDQFGMIGFGEVYRWYKAGLITADDEVAVLHAPAELGYAPLTVSTVDIRDFASEATREGVVSSDFLADAVSCAQQLHFKDRTWDNLAQALLQTQTNESVSRFFDFTHRGAPGVKARDASKLLRALSAWTCKPAQDVGPNFELRNTIFLHRLEEGERAHPQTAMSDEEWTNFTTQAGAGLRAVARETAATLGWTLHPMEVSSCATEYLISHGAFEPCMQEEWLREQQLTEASFWSLVNDILFVRRLRKLQSLRRGAFESLAISTRDPG